MKRILGAILAALILAGPAFGQSNALSNTAKLNDLVSAKDPAYAGGAKGNGTTDDSAAVTAAIAAIAAGGELTFSKGTYILQNVTINKAITIRCEGAKLKLKAAATGPIFKLASDDVTIRGCQFDGDRYNQSGALADSVVFHRSKAAISSENVTSHRTRIIDNEFANFYSSAVVVIGDDLVVEANVFRDLNTEGLITGYHSSDSAVFSDGVTVVGNTFRRIGVKTSALDARQYGNALPVVTGDAVLIRGQNVVVSGNRFIDIDRGSVKFEFVRRNIVVSGNVHYNSYAAGDSSFVAVQFQTNGYTPSATDPNNIVVQGEVVRRSGGFLLVGSVQLFGLVIKGNNAQQFGGGVNGIVNIDIASDVLIEGNRLYTNVASQTGLKINAANALLFSNIAVIGNDISAPIYSVWIVGTNAVASTDLLIKGNILRGGGNGVISDDSKLDRVFILDNIVKATDRGFRFTTGAGTLRTNWVVAGNISDSIIEIIASSINLKGNVTTNLGSAGRTSVSAISSGTGAFYDDSPGSGDIRIFTDLAVTPSVKGARFFRASNSGATLITNFTDGVTGQEITIHFTNGNTTLVNGATMKLAGAANFVGTATDLVTLVFDGTSAIWVEKSRSVN